MNKQSILSWFTGKSLEKATVALDAVIDSMAQGYWTPGVSRSARAALSKANVAAKFARKNKAALEMDYSQEAKTRVLWNLGMALSYGFEYAAKVNPADLELSGASVAVVEFGTRFVRDMAPLASVFETLDATRPPPVFTSLGVSPTVTATLTGLGLKPATVRVCPIEWIEKQKVDPKTGKVTFYSVGILRWPAGTVHKASRYRGSACGNSQCEACGHAIKNAFNWVPLLLDNEAGVPHSMWVGRDCSENVFGIKVTGEVELAEGSR